MINVQFSDSTETVIVSYFGAPQDSAAFANQGTVEITDARYKVFYESLAASLQSGLPIPTGS